jgi:hypothetical protein
MEIPLNQCKPKRADMPMNCRFCTGQVKIGRPYVEYDGSCICPVCMKEAGMTLGGQYGMLIFKESKSVDRENRKAHKVSC